MRKNEQLSQKSVIAGLKTEIAYPHKVSKIVVNETHISWIFLTGSYAYKIKKVLSLARFSTFHRCNLGRYLVKKNSS
jgi:aminoglycoside phosphotransferase family enzyme